MSVSQAAARVYAHALYDICVAGGALDTVSDELHAVRSALDGLDPELRGFFDMPLLRRDDKRHMVSAAFAKKVSRPVLGLLLLLVEKRRESLFDTIVAEFDELVDTHQGRVQASVTTARKLDADLAEALRSALQERSGHRVTLTQRVDPDLIGGMRVSLGDLVFDGSLRRGLSDMRRSLAARQG